MMNNFAGIRLLAWAETIRWIGWGFFEALMPVFLFSFSGSYAESGLLSSVYDIVFMLSLPVVAALADKVSSKILILIGLSIYPFIGLSYFFSGATGIALFIVLARIMNGASYALDSVGRDTYFRRTADKDKVSSTFGYFDTLANFWWVLAVLSSMYLVTIFPIHWLFLALIPTHIIAILMVMKLRPDGKDTFRVGVKKAWQEGIFLGLFREVRSWGKGLKLIGGLGFFLGLVSNIGDFIIPIVAWNSGAELYEVVLITAVYALPSIFGIKLGQFGDKEKQSAIFLALLLLSGIFVMLAMNSFYLIQLLGAFGIGLALELSILTSEGLATNMVREDHYGRLSGAMDTLFDFGGLLGPILLGLMLDTLGNFKAFSISALITVVVLIILFSKRELFIVSNSRK